MWALASENLSLKPNTPLTDCEVLNESDKLFLFSFLIFGHTLLILVSQPGIKPTPPALEGGGGHNHWTTRQVPSHINSLIFGLLLCEVRMMIRED